MESTSSRMKPPTSMRLPSDTGPKVDTRPDVPMPPRQPVASTSSTFAPSRAAQIAAALPAAGDEDIEPLLGRNIAREPVGLHRQLLLGFNSCVRRDLAVACETFLYDV